MPQPEDERPRSSTGWLSHVEPWAPWLAVAIFFTTALAQIEIVLPNFDEGVYILQAQRIQDGDAPYAGFFYHQTPLYLYALAAFTALAPSSLFMARLLSLIATALTGIVVLHLGRTWLGRPAGLAAQWLFYFAPLQRFGMLALPNALMVLCSSIAVFALVGGTRKRWTVVAGVSFAFAVLLKPLAVPVVIAALLGLPLRKETRHKLPLLIASGAATALTGWLAFHAASAGGFTQVLSLQLDRYAGRRGLEVMMHFDGMREAMEDRGVSTPFGWNVSEHAQAFTSFGPVNSNLWLLVAAAAGLLPLRRLTSAAAKAWIPLWLLLPVSFSLWVWEPVWDHYFLQYLPPLSLLAACTVVAAWHRRRMRLAALAFVSLYGLLGIATRPMTADWYERARRVGAEQRGGEAFSFMPLLHVVGGTRPACGFIDPMNVYGEYCAAAIDRDGPLMRFHVSQTDLLACLKPQTPVLIDSYAFWFLDRSLARAFVERNTPLHFLLPAYEQRFARLAGLHPPLQAP